jgi:Na+-transporting NADH:ubiquinone oxidoreductase subunit A
MDILPEFLFKAMITGNIDKMELLGGYEIAPEDVALCEYVCTSKLPLQLIVREALDVMKKNSNKLSKLKQQRKNLIYEALRNFMDK